MEQAPFGEALSVKHNAATDASTDCDAGPPGHV